MQESGEVQVVVPKVHRPCNKCKTGGDRCYRLRPRLIFYCKISNMMSETYFFSMVFSNRNPVAINAAIKNTNIVSIFLPFLYFKLNIALLPRGMGRFPENSQTIFFSFVILTYIFTFQLSYLFCCAIYLYFHAFSMLSFPTIFLPQPTP